MKNLFRAELLKAIKYLDRQLRRENRKNATFGILGKMKIAFGKILFNTFE